MKSTPSLTAERLCELLHYDPETGVFTWRTGKRCGKPAGSFQNDKWGGKVILHLPCGAKISAHQAAWRITYGDVGLRALIHIDGDSRNNRLSNLQLKLIRTSNRNSQLDAETLRRLVSYDPTTGEFLWLEPEQPRYKGSVAGSLNRITGYVTIHILGKARYAHRLAILYVSGRWPASVDHVNRNKADNRLSNLRECSQAENCQNTPTLRSNTSGHKGVSLHSKKHKWVAQLGVQHKTMYLGIFADINDAIAARKAAEAKYHPFAPKDTQHA